jgi:hypothetical protein
LLFIIVPFLLLLIAVPIISSFSDTGSTGFGRSLMDNSIRSFGGLGGLSEMRLQAGEVDSLLSKYTMALESDECMDRIICELGVKASGLPSKDLFFR